MNQKDAEVISNWRYDGPIAFYNAEIDHEDLQELLDPRRRGYHYYSAFDGDRLAGYFSFHYERETRITTVGLGLAPNLTGKGLGGIFVKKGLAFGVKTFPGTSVFKLSVAAFNKRAVKVYEEAGFRLIGKSFMEINGGVYRFLHMEKVTAA